MLYYTSVVINKKTAVKHIYKTKAELIEEVNSLKRQLKELSVSALVSHVGITDPLLKDIAIHNKSVDRYGAVVELSPNTTQAEIALQEREASLRILIDSTSHTYFLLDDNYKILMFNKNAVKFTKKYFGKAPQIGDSILQYALSSSVESLKEDYQHCLQGNRIKIETKVNLPDGNFAWFEVHFHPVFSPEKKVIGASFGALDITNRKTAEEQISLLFKEMQVMNEGLTVSEEELKQILQQTLNLNEQLAKSEALLKEVQTIARLGRWEYDVSTQTVYWLDEILRLYGLENTTGKSDFSQYLNLIHPDDRLKLKQAIDEAVNFGKSYELEIKLIPNNTVRWTLAIGKPILDDKGKTAKLIGISLDITDRKNAEEALLNSKNFLTKIINTIPNPVFVKDRQHRWVMVNKTEYTFLGTDSQERIGKTDYDFFPKHQADVFWATDEEVFRTRQDNTNEEEITDVSGKTYCIKTKKSLFVDSSGEEFIVGVIDNITERKQYESQLKEQNEELKKINAELDKFVYRASHDLRAPLVSILGLINIAKLEPSEEKKAEYFDLMSKSIYKLDKFIQDIINYSKNTRLEIKKEEIDFHDLVNETFEDVKYIEDTERIEKIIHIEEGEKFISDKGRLNMIFNNLISNAIRYRTTRRKKSYISVKIKVADRKCVIEIKDNGIGIGEEHLEKVFEMFYRASESKAGSGLGLYIVKEATEALQGHIQIKSALEKGTKFTITLPDLDQIN